jgi:hypothetical protein
LSRSSYIYIYVCMYVCMYMYMYNGVLHKGGGDLEQVELRSVYCHVMDSLFEKLDISRRCFVVY